MFISTSSYLFTLTFTLIDCDCIGLVLIISSSCVISSWVIVLLLLLVVVEGKLVMCVGLLMLGGCMVLGADVVVVIRDGYG